MTKKETNPHTTFRFKESIKIEFQNACANVGYSMTDVIEMMMVDFIKTTKKLTNEK
jgi:antitoxin component of RelBE/YafQ-DinJ toxin-antitoxin module